MYNSVPPYTGYPERWRTDQLSVFTSDLRRQRVNCHGIQLRISGVKVHRSLRIGDRLHDPLRIIYSKISHDFLHVQNYFVLRGAVKAISDTIGENGLVASWLVFGIIRSFPIINSDLFNQLKTVMDIIKTAQPESSFTKRRVLKARTREIPPAIDWTYKLEEDVFCVFPKWVKMVRNVHR